MAAYAQGLAAPSPRTGITVAPRADNVFGALYSRMLLVDPSAPPPQTPPATAFLGDAVTLAISLPLGRGRGGVENLADESGQAEGVTTPTLPSPRGEESSLATFVASGPNAAGIVTEILVQPLANAKRRRYLEKYRHAALATFAAGHLVQGVPLAKGWYAAAYRFIRAGTGQATALAEIGVFEVV